MNTPEMVRNVALCRRYGVPSIFAYFQQLVMNDDGASKTILPVAMGLTSEDDHTSDIPAWVTLRATGFIARRIADDWAKVNLNVEGERRSDENRREGRFFGEYTALHCAYRFDNVTNAQNAIVDILRRTEPSGHEFLEYVNALLRRCARVRKMAVYPAKEAKLYIPDLQEDGSVSAQTFIFYKGFGHCVNYDVFSSRETRDTWLALRDLHIAWVDLSKVDVTLVDDFPSRWASSPVSSILGFYDGLGDVLFSEMKSKMAACLIVYIYVICFRTNADDGWIDRYKRRFEHADLIIRFDGYDLTCVAKAYWNMYNCRKHTTEQTKKILAMCWSQISNLAPPYWLLEDAAGPEIEGAFGFAEFCSAMPFTDLEMLCKPDRISSVQFNCLANVAKDLIRDRYVGFKAPSMRPQRNYYLSTLTFEASPNPLDGVKDYPDLAYLGMYIKKKYLDGERCDNFRPDRHAESATSMLQLFAENLKKRNDFMSVPPPSNEDLLLASRDNWSKEAQSLPPNARYVTKREIVETTLKSYSERMKAFHVIMAALLASRTQPLFKTIPMAAGIPRFEKTVFSRELVDAFALWNITIPHAWMVRCETTAHSVPVLPPRMAYCCSESTAKNLPADPAQPGARHDVVADINNENSNE